MKDFLAQGQAANTYRPGNEHKILAAIAEKYFGSPVAPNVEELATFLLTDLGSDPLKDKELRAVAYDQLIGIIRDTLEGISIEPAVMMSAFCIRRLGRRLSSGKYR